MLPVGPDQAGTPPTEHLPPFPGPCLTQVPFSFSLCLTLFLYSCIPVKRRAWVKIFNRIRIKPLHGIAFLWGQLGAWPVTLINSDSLLFLFFSAVDEWRTGSLISENNTTHEAVFCFTFWSYWDCNKTSNSFVSNYFMIVKKKNKSVFLFPC